MQLKAGALARAALADSAGVLGDYAEMSRSDPDYTTQDTRSVREPYEVCGRQVDKEDGIPGRMHLICWNPHQCLAIPLSGQKSR